MSTSFFKIFFQSAFLLFFNIFTQLQTHYSLKNKKINIILALKLTLIHTDRHQLRLPRGDKIPPTAFIAEGGNVIFTLL